MLYNILMYTSLRPPSISPSSPLRICIPKMAAVGHGEKLEPADHLVSYSNVETILVIADPLPRLFMPIVPKFLLLIRFDSN